MQTLTIDDLGFLLAIDGCARNCSHCPAYGMGQRPVMADIEDLRTRLRSIRAAAPAVDFANFRTIHSWRIGDMSDYRYTADGVTYDAASVAEAWYGILGQPLYVVTNGTLGSHGRGDSLSTLVAHPEMVSQVKLTVTPFDPRFGRGKYVQNMARDVAECWHLTQLPSERYESFGRGQTKFRINAKAAPSQYDEVREVVREILLASGLSAQEVDGLVEEDGTIVQIKPVYDLRVSESQPRPEGAISLGTPDLRVKPEEVRDRNQLGFRPDGSAFRVDLWSFHEHDDLPAGHRTFQDWFPL